MIDQHEIEIIRQKYTLLRPELDERARRCWAAVEALALGYGGVSALAHATGLARNTVAAGIQELTAFASPHPGRIRHPGGGRKAVTQIDPELAAALDTLVDPVTRGDPQSPLR
jgi:hypothetical protein